MDTRKKLIYCLIGNFVAMLAVVLVVSLFKDDSSTYLRFGPSDDLILVSIKINTWGKWSGALLFIAVIRGCEVLVNEIGSPILGFNVYNPDKKVITDFTKNELNIYANTMWTLNSLRSVLMVIINITQFDLALSSVIVSELVSIFTVRMLLNEKQFVRDGDQDLNMGYREFSIPIGIGE